MSEREIGSTKGRKGVPAYNRLHQNLPVDVTSDQATESFDLISREDISATSNYQAQILQLQRTSPEYRSHQKDNESQTSGSQDPRFIDDKGVFITEDHITTILNELGMYWEPV